MSRSSAEGGWRLSSYPRDRPHAVGRLSMLPYRAVRAYFASFLIIALCVCGFKHAILMTRLGLTSQTVDAEQLPQLMADIRQSTAPVVGEMPSVSSLSPQLSLEEAGALLRQDAEAELKARDAGGTGLSTVSNETTRVDSAKTDRNAATFGATADDRCRPETMGVPPRVAEQCNENADMSGGSSSSKGHQACFLLTCYNMVNDPSIADKLSAIAADFEASHPARIPTDDEMSAMGSRCDVWRSKYGFDNMPPVSRDEEDFPLAFNVLAHQHAHQVARLLRAIYRPHNSYCIHVDARSSTTFREAVSSLAACFNNVRLASRLERVVYAGFSRLQADVNCMKDHLNPDLSTAKWRYLINTAGQAFPLRTNAELVQILRLYNGSNDIEGIYGGRVLRGRFENEWIENETAGAMHKTGRRNPPPPHDIDIVRGSAYGVFSRNFVRFIVEDQRARDLLEWSRRTWSPDEFYWATLHHTYSNPHLHSPGGFSGYPSDKPWLAVYANWGEVTCHGRFVRGVCVFGVGDLPALVRRREMFANKFHVDFEPMALDCLEAWLRHKEMCPPPFDREYYSKLAFIPRPLV